MAVTYIMVFQDADIGEYVFYSDAFRLSTDWNLLTDLWEDGLLLPNAAGRPNQLIRIDDLERYFELYGFVLRRIRTLRA